MIKLSINLGDRSYPIYVANSFTGMGRYLASSGINGKLVVITDANVDVHYSQECLEALNESGFQTCKHVIAAGEKSKNLDTVKEIYRHLSSLKLDRASTLAALGGGVVGDITGFAAATFLRGINFVQMPTSLLAQADSSVGGKVGVDFEGSKNIIGAFYQPKLVFINVNTLKTLPERELKAGLAEVVKHGIIRSNEFFEFLEYNIRKIFSFDEDTLQYVTKMNCTIKGNVVEQDEKENGLRADLNFGHTIGHAIESVTGFELLHGECVSLGIIGAFRMARYLEMVTEETAARVENLLDKIGLPVRMHEIEVDKVYRQMFFDKKMKKDKLRFILPKDIGEVVQCVIDDERLIKRVLNDLIR